METKTPSWAKWMLAILIIGLIAWGYSFVNSNLNPKIQDNKAKKESLQNNIDTISVKQADLATKAKDYAKSYTDKGNNTIKVIYYEKKPIVLPAADSVHRYIAAYSFTERK
jgi:hypothetical protein